MVQDEKDSLAEVESLLFRKLLSSDSPPDIPALFVLGAPRIGSTFCYQALIDRFSLTYFSNLANDVFFRHPVLATVMQTQVAREVDISYESQYGKTVGPFQPSEASLIFRHWYGGGHPSHTNSVNVRDGKRSHMLRTMGSCVSATGKLIVVKNAWNCFRVRSLAETFPNAYFIWVRRDIVASSISDLAARYAVHKSPYVWNSATPRNYTALQERPYWEQVVENQYQFNNAINEDLSAYAGERHLALWYEQLCSSVDKVMCTVEAKLRRHFGNIIAQRQNARPKIHASRTQLNEGDEVLIKNYVEQNKARFRSMALLEHE